MLSSKEIIAAEFFHRYIPYASGYPLPVALRKSGAELNELLENIKKKKANYAYAEGKWTLKEVLQHIIDAERVFVLRAVWIARKDSSPLPGFDENSWAANANTHSRNWKDLLKEFRLLRKSTLLFFDSLNDEQLLTKGVVSGFEINVLALGYICSGHALHHARIIRERYLDM